ncbi:MAG: phosphatidate cytidylyltransferase [Clostridia bacterium]|nr:phosphatidate cytidylyltransferase [Clostridia bacterium]
MKQRLITGSAYIAVLLGFFLLKVFLPEPWGALSFDLLLYAFCVVGAFEMTRAMGEKLNPACKWIAFLFAVCVIPAYDVSCYLFGYDKLSVLAVEVFVVSVVLCSVLVIGYEYTTLENVGMGLLSCFYPTILLGVMVLCNHLEVYSDLAILFIFVVSPCADSFALVFGLLFGKKLPQKMSPHISPKKTWIGGVGGVLGGMVGAVVLYFIYNAVVFGSFDWAWLPLYIIMGAGASVFTEFGDLVESAIKRKVGIKDMGKILPGHGGVLDRIDGSMYAAVFVYLVLFIAIKAFL